MATKKTVGHVWTPKEPIKARRPRILGRSWARFTCGTCGARSPWGREHKLSTWVHRHYIGNRYCSETRPL